MRLGDKLYKVVLSNSGKFTYFVMARTPVEAEVRTKRYALQDYPCTVSEDGTIVPTSNKFVPMYYTRSIKELQGISIPNAEDNT